MIKKCPSEQELESLIDERLSRPQLLALSTHVETCLRCQAALERLTLDTLPRMQLQRQVLLARARPRAQRLVPDFDPLRGIRG
jgi:hypothetical protein